MLANVGTTKVKAKERPSTSVILEDPTTRDQTKMLAKMVENYISILDTTIRDATPKYIVLLLGELVPCTNIM